MSSLVWSGRLESDSANAEQSKVRNGGKVVLCKDVEEVMVERG